MTNEIQPAGNLLQPTLYTETVPVDGSMFTQLLEGMLPLEEENVPSVMQEELPKQTADSLEEDFLLDEENSELEETTNKEKEKETENTSFFIPFGTFFQQETVQLNWIDSSTNQQLSVETLIEPHYEVSSEQKDVQITKEPDLLSSIEEMSGRDFESLSESAKDVFLSDTSLSDSAENETQMIPADQLKMSEEAPHIESENLLQEAASFQKRGQSFESFPSEIPVDLKEDPAEKVETFLNEEEIQLPENEKAALVERPEEKQIVEENPTEGSQSAIPSAKSHESVRQETVPVPIASVSETVKELAVEFGQTSSSGEVTETTLQLSPESLGKMDIRIQKKKDGLEMSIKVEKPASKERIEKQLEQVKAVLQKENAETKILETMKITISVSEQSLDFSQQFRSFQQQQRERQPMKEKSGLRFSGKKDQTAPSDEKDSQSGRISLLV